ncbi:MAG: flavin reductase family protein [Proteobacteria bacterium]|nr:flavin reductase family protein [Pseudomonadota bacterium]MBU1611543.1 flavin reductase family protein [Pseudomonadota bacterium]
MKKSLGAEIFVLPTPAWVVGSYDGEGKANAMTIAWGGVCCSKPPCITVSLRQATYTYECILERQAFTVNIPSEAHVAQVDYFGMVSGRNVDKFAATGLTAVKAGSVDAPSIEEFPLVLECALLHTIEIGLHTQFIGEIKDVRADEAVLVDGVPVMDRVLPVLYGTGAKSYFKSGPYLGKAFSIGRGFMK